MAADDIVIELLPHGREVVGRAVAEALRLAGIERACWAVARVTWHPVAACILGTFADEFDAHAALDGLPPCDQVTQMQVVVRAEVAP